MASAVRWARITADLLERQLVLVRKGTLKCHRLRNEGGTVAMELTEYHGGYKSPAVWATTMVQTSATAVLCGAPSE
jgi:hypothetical protein